MSIWRPHLLSLYLYLAHLPMRFFWEGSGSDTITSGTGDDVLVGYSGDDTITIDGAGDKTVDGGPGRGYIGGELRVDCEHTRFLY